MKNLFSVLLIVTLAVASSVSAQAVPQADVEDSMLQEALWNKMKKNHHHHEKNDGDCQKKHFSFRCDDACLIECLFDERGCQDVCRHEVTECSRICREHRGKCGLNCQGPVDACNASCLTLILDCEAALRNTFGGGTAVVVPPENYRLVCESADTTSVTCKKILHLTATFSETCDSPFVTPYLGVGGICKAACDGKKLACEKTCDTEDHDCEKDCLFKDDKCEKGCRFRGQDCKDRCRFRRGDRLDDRFPLEHEDGFPFEHEDGFPLEHEPFPEFDNLENTAPPA